MSTLVIAKKDFQDAIRSRTLFILAGLFTAFLAFFTYHQFLMANPSQPTRAGELYSTVASVVTVIGTLLGYKAIVGERETGSLKFLLGQPHTRRDVVVGKFLGRAAVVVVTVFVAFAVVAAHYAVLSVSPSVTAYALLTGKIAVLGVVFVAIAIAFSAALNSATVATWGAIGLVIVFSFGWETVLELVSDAIFSSTNPIPNWFYLLQQLNPKWAFLDIAPTYGTGGEIPFYLESWFAVVILGAWIVVPLALAYLQFQRSDLA